MTYSNFQQVWLGLVIIHQLKNAPDINIDRAKLHTSPASHAGYAVSIFIDIILKLMHESLPDPLDLFSPRVMASSVKGEQRIHTGIPVAYPDPFGPPDFVLDIKTPAGRTQVGAGPAMDAGKLDLVPERGIE